MFVFMFMPGRIWGYIKVASARTIRPKMQRMPMLLLLVLPARATAGTAAAATAIAAAAIAAAGAGAAAAAPCWCCQLAVDGDSAAGVAGAAAAAPAAAVFVLHIPSAVSRAARRLIQHRHWLCVIQGLSFLKVDPGQKEVYIWNGYEYGFVDRPEGFDAEDDLDGDGIFSIEEQAAAREKKKKANPFARSSATPSQSPGPVEEKKDLEEVDEFSNPLGRVNGGGSPTGATFEMETDT